MHPCLFGIEGQCVTPLRGLRKRRYPAYLHVTDIAGLVRGAAEGAGLGNAFLSNISAVDGIFHVASPVDAGGVQLCGTGSELHLVLLVQQPLVAA